MTTTCQWETRQQFQILLVQRRRVLLATGITADGCTVLGSRPQSFWKLLDMFGHLVMLPMSLLLENKPWTQFWRIRGRVVSAVQVAFP